MSAESSRLPEEIDRDAPIFAISVAARLAGMHPQTLRTYDRMGLVSPRRTSGRGRRYSPRDVARLRLVQHLSQVEGINLEGIRRILQMQDSIDELQQHVTELEERLRDALVAPAGARFFTADPVGGVRLGSYPAHNRLPRALTRY
ncbi:MerR family transcriptional regulator, heat shock protein HspR [Raineyella antarctica]|uniref:MerR family transcriptional regulator, heat shock protein HspR n=1 Tax=Raineyella antarctica TaxID=1577474 RepID=A0A1G6H734_9ACTN|nr:helix-turn-helix transcriptional regulator [Raineyella antarctica]SDB89964.1 MerR family transcriptional regulator, heat shock protein HspR [Raineyella antarctica]